MANYVFAQDKENNITHLRNQRYIGILMSQIRIMFLLNILYCISYCNVLYYIIYIIYYIIL
jgi:hypothetical protein